MHSKICCEQVCATMSLVSCKKTTVNTCSTETNYFIRLYDKRPGLIMVIYYLNFQIDLIDMRHKPDGSFKWIGHYLDYYWAKCLVLFPLVRKLTAAEVAVALSNQVFAVLGTPDNVWEFVNEIIHSIVKEWPGEVMVVNGRPRNPKCQGLIEQGNGMVEKLLGCRLYAHEGDSQPVWSEWLPFIQCKSV